jgi:hypothetical protein
MHRTNNLFLFFITNKDVINTNMRNIKLKKSGHHLPFSFISSLTSGSGNGALMFLLPTKCFLLEAARLMYFSSSSPPSSLSSNNTNSFFFDDVADVLVDLATGTPLALECLTAGFFSSTKVGPKKYKKIK